MSSWNKQPFRRPQTHAPREIPRAPHSWWIDAPREGMTALAQRDHLLRMRARGIAYFNPDLPSGLLGRASVPKVGQ